MSPAMSHNFLLGVIGCPALLCLRDFLQEIKTVSNSGQGPEKREKGELDASSERPKDGHEDDPDNANYLE
jgi:hypothetical protein